MLLLEIFPISTSCHKSSITLTACFMICKSPSIKFFILSLLSCLFSSDWTPLFKFLLRSNYSHIVRFIVIIDSVLTKEIIGATILLAYNLSLALVPYWSIKYSAGPFFFLPTSRRWPVNLILLLNW
jgi:hypothetical protein